MGRDERRGQRLKGETQEKKKKGHVGLWRVLTEDESGDPSSCSLSIFIIFLSLFIFAQKRTTLPLSPPSKRKENQTQAPEKLTAISKNPNFAARCRLVFPSSSLSGFRIADGLFPTMRLTRDRSLRWMARRRRML